MKNRATDLKPPFEFKRICTICNNPLEYYVVIKQFEQEIPVSGVLKAQDVADERRLGKCVIESGYSCTNCRVTVGRRSMDYQARAPYDI